MNGMPNYHAAEGALFCVIDGGVSMRLLISGLFCYVVK